MRRRLARTAVFLLLLLAVLSCTAAAAQDSGVFYIAQSPETVRRGSAFRVSLAPEQPVSAFVLFAEYDSADIERAEAAISGASSGDYTYVSVQEGRVAVVYTAENGRTMPADARITFTFKTRSGALSDALPVYFTATDAADADARPLLTEPQTLEAAPVFQPEPSSDSALTALEPPEGALSPAFDPDIFDYTLEVPYASTSLVFDAVPAEGADVRVNRKNLGAGGSTVDFEFTVTAADGETKTTYTVAVTRLKKNAAASAGSTGGTGGGRGADDEKTESGGTESDAPPSAAPDSIAAAAEGGIPSAPITENTQTGSTAEAPQDTAYDRLLTVGLTLLSVGFGAALTLLLLHFLPAAKKHKGSGRTAAADENRPES